MLSERRKRALGVGSLLLLASIILFVPVKVAWVNSTTGGLSLSFVLIGIVPFAASVGVIAALAYSFYNDVETTHILAAAGWAWGAVAFSWLMHQYVIQIQRVGGSVNYRLNMMTTVATWSVVGLAVGASRSYRTEQQRALEDERDRFSSLFENTTDAVIEVVAAEDGTPPGDFADWFHEDGVNRTFDLMFDRGPVALLRDAVPNEGAEYDFATLRGHVTEGASYDTELRLEVDGETRYFILRTVEAAGRRSFITLTDITEQQRAQHELADRERNLREMYDLISDPTRSFEAKVDGLISIGRSLFGTEYGAFARIDADENEYQLEVVQSESLELRAGDVVPYTQTHCQQMVEHGKTIQFETRPFDEPMRGRGGFEFGDGDGEDSTDRDYGTGEEFEMYVGTPISVSGETYGALCFLNREEVAPFEDWQLTLTELMGSWVGYELDRKQLLEERERRLRESEARFESIVETVDDYAIFTADTDGAVQNWNAGARNILGYDSEEIVGRPVAPLGDHDGDDERREILAEAREEGRVTYEGVRTRKDGSRFWADVTVSARYDETDALAGYTIIVRDMTEQRAYQETIEHERERLEFMNRIVRHNILNGLHLINGRSELLEEAIDGDDDASEHLALIQDRVLDMSHLIDTMRTFMDAVLADTDHEVHPVSLREELETKLTLARESYDAEFTVRGLPPEETAVGADELLGEVFENVISNAVVHNDAETPHVEVWVTRDRSNVPVNGGTASPTVVAPPAETERRDVLTVHVADNGPGIPDREKEAVLRKGSSRFSEPGHGFGLYLVREMMDTYGGSIDIRDNQPRGTVFDLTLPLSEADEAV